MQIEWIEDQEYFQDWGKRRFTAKIGDRVHLFIDEVALTGGYEDYNIRVIVWFSGKRVLADEYAGSLEEAKSKAEALAIERVPAWIEAQRKALDESIAQLNEISASFALRHGNSA